jgi:hypothetical protein
MAQISLYVNQWPKRGPAITNASFQQKLWDERKREYRVNLPVPGGGSGPEGNIYSVFLASGAVGTIVITAGNRSTEPNISNAGTYTFWV